MHVMPARNVRITRWARAASFVNTAPAKPYGESFAMRIAPISVFGSNPSPTTMRSNSQHPRRRTPPRATAYRTRAFRARRILRHARRSYPRSAGSIRARSSYAMSRDGLFAPTFARSHPRFRTPHRSLAMFATICLAVGAIMLGLGLSPIDAFDDTSTLGSFGFVAIYAFVAIAAPVYLRRRGELRPRHVAVAVGTVALLVIPAVDSVYPVPPQPSNYFPYALAAYMAIARCCCGADRANLRVPASHRSRVRHADRVEITSPSAPPNTECTSRKTPASSRDCWGRRTRGRSRCGRCGSGNAMRPSRCPRLGA
jgi:amino acid transporter